MTVLRDWRELAACRNTVTARYDPFFDRTEEGEQAAIAVCRTCRVQGECLAYAVRTGQSYGVWGGRPQQELRRLVALDRLGRAQVRASGRRIATRPRTAASTATASTPPTPTTHRPGSDAVAPAGAPPAAPVTGAAARRLNSCAG